MTTYAEFLDGKRIHAAASGFTPSEVNPKLFDFQSDIVKWACRKGKAAVWLDCGMGKSGVQLEWARLIHDHTGGDVLILAPLAVAQQTRREADKFAIAAPVTVCRSQGDVQPGINITNYEMLQHFDPAYFAGIVLDECFAPGTVIDTPGGEKRIEDVRVGDAILNAAGADTVSDVHRRKVTYAVYVQYSGRRVLSSPNHPFFTQRGWVAAQDLQPGDSLVDTAEAMRMVRADVRQEERRIASRREVLRSVLLSEMAYASAGAPSEGAHSGSGGQEGGLAEGVLGVRSARGHGRDRADQGAESNKGPRSAREDIPRIEDDEAQSFRAWGQWPWLDETSAASAGCTWVELEAGVRHITGPTGTWLSNELQAGLGAARATNRYRGGWVLSLLAEGTGHKEGYEAGFTRVDGIEVLEPGDPRLDGFRDADGCLYFYDLGATRHPSYSIAGCLVHNSSILKAQDGKTRTALIEAFRDTPYRLACTATPAPNDHMELGNHAEFLGTMTGAEMLSMFFVHDGGDTSQWRMKKHAERAFWEWVASWAVLMRRPSDLGYDDAGFALPPLNVETRVVNVDDVDPGDALFATAARTLMEQRQARKATIGARVAAVAERVNASDEPFLIWCDLNDESSALAAAIPDAVEVTGSDSPEHKESAMLGFVDGKHRVLVSKSSIAGFGMNFQHCHNMEFVGISHSWEAYYQAIRRCWRFGQESPVNVTITVSDLETSVTDNIRRKEAEAVKLAEGMVEHTAAILTAEIHGTARDVADYEVTESTGDGWRLVNGDCVEGVSGLPDNSVGFSVFSPPFSSLYTYSNSERDMGNSKDRDEFARHFRYLIRELYRVLMPGRLVSFHCMNLPTLKSRDGFIGIEDFRGDLIRAFQAEGFIFHSEVVIWKDPVTAMQRTKALGLLHKQIKKDSAMSRQGIPDYLITMRKPGDNPVPVAGPFDHYAGNDAPPGPTGTDRYSIEVWQRYASPVWMDIHPSDTLQFRSAREHDDERHICPLQLQVIHRALQLWSMPGDLVLSPFAGIGSEGWEAVKMGRRFVGFELKGSYYREAARNLTRAVAERDSGTLFDTADSDLFDTGQDALL